MGEPTSVLSAHLILEPDPQPEQCHAIQPLPFADRNTGWDVLRGAALLGVLMINLLYSFRVSLFDSILNFHTHPGWANHAVDILVAWLFEFKALTLLSFLFGAGIGAQAQGLIHPACRDGAG